MLDVKRTHRRFMQQVEKGQSIVETTFGMVVLVIIMAGMLDLGRMYFTFVALEDAAGEAAMFLSINPYCAYDSLDGSGNYVADNLNPGDGCDPPNNAVWRAQEAGGGLIEWSDVVVVASITDTATGTGDIVEVEIQYEFPLLLPLIPEIAGSPSLTLTSRASQTVVTE